MTSLAYDISAQPSQEPGDRLQAVINLPRITIDAFCETPELTATLEAASRDRRVMRARMTVRGGGIKAAVDSYKQVVTPDLIVLESQTGEAELLAQLDELASVCVASTKVVVIGHSNDIALYRALLDKGISDYLLAPVDELAVIGAIAQLYQGPGTQPLGKIIAFVGAKGGSGSSTVAHNVAWAIGHHFDSSVLLADLDLPFGTAGLDFNLEQGAGIGDALQDVEGLDELKLDRLLAKYDDHLSLLGAPAELATPYDVEQSTSERIVEIARAGAPFLVLDVPHLWTSWARQILLEADEVVITAEPDLANFRNTKGIVEWLRQSRPNDAAPKLVLNRTGTPKRPEIKANEFSGPLDLKPVASISFDPKLFGTAANKGQMIGEKSNKSKTAEVFTEIAKAVTGREAAAGRKRASGLRMWKR